tara:strand:+ start:190 stop:606 length:417 start_codon:yes stop_codon:yes gene_type:complete
MTPHHSTPSIWVVYNNRNEAANLIDRISDFSEGHFWDSSAVNDFLLNIDKHRSSWLVVDSKSSEDSDLQAAAHKASSTYEFFRCLVIGSNKHSEWPENSIHIEKNTLSTSIIDRLRNESHVLRMASSRVRHMRRLQNR